MQIRFCKSREKASTHFCVASGKAFPVQRVLLRIDGVGFKQTIDVFRVICVELCLNDGER